ncbi:MULTISPECIES: response regulator transcription factor [unclassified Blastococcus]|uniref:response regulator transcription factor n=1 Tax=unclassified Blastococcus TaxID=2619396 RepID=UPI001EF0743A|nr:MULTISPECIES: response regulator transcription factor [unclassified Blastococcus]
MDELVRFSAIDDHDIILFAVEAMAAREPDLEYCGGATDARRGLELVEETKPDLVLLDLRLGAGNSFPLCEELSERAPGTGILMFTAFANEDLLQGAIHAGAVGYLLKDTSTSALPHALRSAKAEGAYFDPRVVNASLIGSKHGKDSALTERELAILRLVADGKDNHQIAEALQFSVHTIKLNIAQMLKRFGVRRRAELVKVLMERQLLT